MPLRLTRRALAALLTLGLALTTSGCSGTLYGPGMKPWAPPVMCVERCREIPDPEALGLHEWHVQVIERYTHCAVTHDLCAATLGVQY